MVDGIYQSAVAFFFLYELFAPATFVTSNGLDIAEYRRMGIYAATTAVCAANIYVLYNTYRWDWLMVLIVVISTLFVWLWTGVYTSFTSSAQFYKAGAEAYGTLNFWAYVLCATIACLLPRFIFKVVQKMYFPLDADIIREQVKLGKFDYLRDTNSYIPPPPEKVEIEEDRKPSEVDATKYKAANAVPTDEDVRPMYPPSVAPTATTHNPRSQNGSNSTDYTFRRSVEGLPPAHSQSMDGPQPHAMTTDGPPLSHRMSTSEYRVRPSFDRARMSMDRVRPSFEQSNDFTSAAMLTRLESSHSRNSYQGNNRNSYVGVQQSNTNNQPTVASRLRNAIRRATVTRDEAPEHLRDRKSGEVPDVPVVPKSPPRSPRSPPR
jgi:phospholipid-translocating ATPase